MSRYAFFKISVGIWSSSANDLSYKICHFFAYLAAFCTRVLLQQDWWVFCFVLLCGFFFV